MTKHDARRSADRKSSKSKVNQGLAYQNQGAGRCESRNLLSLTNTDEATTQLSLVIASRRKPAIDASGCAGSGGVDPSASAWDAPFFWSSYEQRAPFACMCGAGVKVQGLGVTKIGI
jgi:hypothetical protein